MRKSLFLAATLSTAVAIALCVAPPAVFAFLNIDIGSEMPDFALKDIEGKEHKLSTHRGKIVVLVSWTMKCKHCRAVDPCIEELIDHYQDKGVVFYAISASSQFQTDAIRAYREDKGYSLTILDDFRNYYLRDLKVTKAPEFFVINQDGKLVYRGALDDRTHRLVPGSTNYIKDAIDALQSGLPIKTTTMRAWGCELSKLVEEQYQ